MSFKPLSGSTLTALRAGFALNTVSSPVNGLMPLRALVAGFLTTLILHKPTILNKPEPLGFNSLAIIPSSAVNTEATCLRVRSVSPAIEFKISDLVGGFLTAAAAFFLTAIKCSSNVSLFLLVSDTKKFMASV